MSSLVVSFLRFGLECGAFVMSLCACSVAWYKAMVAIVRDGNPWWIAAPPMARLIDLWRLALMDFISHPVLLSVPALQAPSDWMNKLVHWLRNSCVLCRW